CLIPIYVRRVRGLGDALYVAMDDPTNAQALAEVAERSGLHVRAMIAPPSDIRAAIRAYYGIDAEPEQQPSKMESMDDSEEKVPTAITSRSEVESSAAKVAAVASGAAAAPAAVESLAAIAPAKKAAGAPAAVASGDEPSGVRRAPAPGESPRRVPTQPGRKMV